MMRKCLIISFFLFTVITALSQRFPISPNAFDAQGRREGHWTILYDSAWKEVHDVDSVVYYRLIRFENGKPSGKVRDFYRNGTRQWDGELTSITPEVFADGVWNYYHENGTLSKKQTFKNGKANGPETNYTKTGKLNYTGQNKDSEADGLFIYYYEDGRKSGEAWFKNNKRNGITTNFYPNGKVKDAVNYVDGNAQGLFVGYHEDGKMSYSVQFVNNIISGLYQSYFPDGSTQTKGQKENDNKIGEWLYYSAPGVLDSKGNYAEGYRNGDWADYFSNGKVKARMNHLDGYKHGPYQTWLEDGSLAEQGTYWYDKQDSAWQYFYPSGKIKEEKIFKRDTLHGCQKSYFENGVIEYEGNKVNGLKEGQWVYRFENTGKVKTTGAFLADEREGEWKYFYEDGTPSGIENFSKGVLNGAVINNYSNGNISDQGTYVEGKLGGFRQEYYESGKIKIEANYKDGVKEGPYKEFFENGTVKEEAYRKNGNYHGLYKVYHPNGVLQAKVEMSDGLYYGPLTFYYDNGKVQSESYYKGSSLDGSIKFYSREGKFYVSGNYKNGKEHGKWVYYDSLTGKKTLVGNYVNGKKNGKWFNFETDKKPKVDYYIMGFHETRDNVKDSVNVLMAQGKYEEAITAIDWMDRVGQRDYTDPVERALPYLYRGRAYSPMREYELALKNDKLYLEAMMKYKNGTASHRTALNDCAVDLKGLNRYDEASLYYDQAIAVGKQVGINNDYWIVVMNKIKFLHDVKRKQESLDLLDSSLKQITGTYADSLQSWHFRDAISEYYYYYVDNNDMTYDNAKALVESIAKYKKFDNEYAYSSYNLMGKIAYKYRQDYDNAMVHYDSAIRYAERNGKTHTPSYAEALVDQYYVMGNKADTAAQSSLVSKVIKTVPFVGKHSIRARMFKLLHIRYYAKDEYENAAAASEASLREAEMAGEQETAFYSGLLQDFAFAEVYRGGDTTRAVNRFVKSLEIRKKDDGAESSSYYTAAYDLATFFVSLRQRTNAVPVLEQEVLPAARKANDEAVIAKAEHLLGDQYYYLYAYDKSLEHLMSALKIYEKDSVSYFNKVITTTNTLSLTYSSLRKFEAALKFGERSLNFVKQKYGEESEVAYSYTGTYAYLLTKAGNYSDALKLYETLSSKYKETKGVDSEEYKNNLGYYAWTLNELKQYRRVYNLLTPYVKPGFIQNEVERWQYDFVSYMVTATSGLKLEQEEGQFIKMQLEASLKHFGVSPTYFSDMLNLADYYERQNQWDAAEKTVNDALNTIRQSSFAKSPRVAYSITRIAEFNSTLDKNKEAEALFLQAIETLKTDTINHESDYEVTLENLATFYAKLGREAEAETILKNLVAFVERHEGKTFYYHRVTGNLIRMLYNQFRFEEARRIISQELPAVEEQFGAYHWLATDLHNYMGIIAEYTHDFITAEKEYRYCRETYLRIPKPTNIELEYIGTYSGNLVNALINQDRAEEAEKMLQEAQTYYKKSGRVLSTDTRIKILRKQLRVFEAKGDIQKADAQWGETFKMLLNYVQENFYFMSDAEKTLLWSDYRPVVQEYFSYASRQYKKTAAAAGQMYNVQLATKALLLSTSNKIRKRILSSGDSSLINMFYRWQRYRNQMAQLIAAPQVGAGYISSIDSLKQRINRLEKELNIGTVEVNADKSINLVDWKQVQSLLKSNEAAIEIIRFDYHHNYKRDSAVYAALILTSETKTAPKLIILPRAKHLEGRALRYYKNAIASRINDTLSYKNYWADLMPHLVGKTNLYLSLDGVFNSINLNTLQSAGGRYLVDDKSIVLLSNSKDLIEIKGRKVKTNRASSASVFGFPKYFLGSQEIEKRIDTKRSSGERALSDIDRSGIAELPGTKVEVEKVGGILKSMHLNVDAYLAENASEELVKGVHHPGILHLATHGYFFDDDKAGGRLGNFSDPMLRAGLLFSGSANFLQDNIYPSNDNGVLTAFEATNLGLDNTDLVVLSACETGKGEVQNGEGVYGLQRAFQTAGAKSILMSLWKVDDEATQQLMTLFYEKWMSGQSKAEAFKQAQLELKAKFPNPYYWGAFVMMGM
jgi:antitoxin component YwqK of YwqJK toxin-antitoxin module/CHAT domain-containing protein